MGCNWFHWADPYRGDRINKFLEDKERFNMEEMLELQVDYFSIPADEILSISDGLIKSNLEYYDKLREWDKKLTKIQLKLEYTLNGKINYSLK